MASEKFRIKQIPKEIRKQEIWSRRAYVDWVNDKLKAHYTNALEFRNGAMYLQLFDSMFPGVVPMDEVKFSANMEYDCYQNFRILEECFKKLNIDKHVDTQALSSGRHVESWTFLKWFKLFYDINFDGKDYDPVKARNNAYMGFGKNMKIGKCDTSLMMQRRKRAGKIISHARSKSMVFQREHLQGKDLYDGNGCSNVEKTCRSVECIYEKREPEFGGGSVSPQASRNCEKERTNGKVKQKPINGKIKHKEEIITEVKSISSDTSTNTIRNDTEKSVDDENSDEAVLVRKGHSQGDFEPKITDNTDVVNSAPAQVSNSNSIVVNKSQTFEEFGVRITENILIRVESTGNNCSTDTSEKRRKINTMIEKFLKYQWIERKEYFQTLAEFLKEDNNEMSE